MKWAVMKPALGRNGDVWIYVTNALGKPLVFDTHAAAEAFASNIKHHKIVEY
jgi:hypothetical protein